MNNDTVRMQNTLREWQDEKKYQEKILKDPEAPVRSKEFAKKRIEEADYYIKKIKEALQT